MRLRGMPFQVSLWGFSKAKTSVSVVHGYLLTEDSRDQSLQSATLVVGDMAKRLLCRAMAKFS